jgi:hypothetical protein
MRKKYRILIRRSTSEQWTTNNPLLLEGEIGLELDTFVITDGIKQFRFKVGNGETYWNDLEYASFGNGSGGGSGIVYWNDIQNKPTTFAPAPHTHPISDVVDLSTTLATKADLSGGKLVSSQLPAIAISEFLGSVADQAEMLSLDGQVGDWCIRNDEERAYVITGETPTELSSWTAIVTPASPVTTVNGQIGDVVLGKSDIGLGNVDNTSDADKPISTATQTALDAKMTTAIYDSEGDGIVDNAERIPIIVRNSTGATLLKGQIVYLSGSTGERPNALLASASSEATSSKTIGMVINDILNNTDGNVACIGTLHNQNTSSFSAGDSLWLSTTAGEMVANTPPAEPNHAVFIGFVARSHPNQGRIVLAIQNGYELNEIHGVSVPSPSDKNVLKYNGVSELWESGTISKSEVGLSNVDNTSDANKPISTATQSALDAKISKVFGYGGFTPASGSTVYMPVQGGTNSPTEAVVQQPAKAGVYKNFMFRNRSVGVAAYTITLRKNGVDTSLVATIGTAIGTYSTTGSATIAEGDLITWKVASGAGNGGVLSGFSGEC